MPTPQSASAAADSGQLGFVDVSFAPDGRQVGDLVQSLSGHHVLSFECLLFDDEPGNRRTEYDHAFRTSRLLELANGVFRQIPQRETLSRRRHERVGTLARVSD